MITSHFMNIESNIRFLDGYSTPLLGSYASWRNGGPSRFSNFSFLRSKIVVGCSNALRRTRKPPCPERSRKPRPTAGSRAKQRGADGLRRRLANSLPKNEEGNFPHRKALKTQRKRKESRRGESRPLQSPLRSRACPEMAPQRLEKIESAPGNGRVSEASNPQHLVYGARG